VQAYADQYKITMERLRIALKKPGLDQVGGSGKGGGKRKVDATTARDRVKKFKEKWEDITRCAKRAILAARSLNGTKNCSPSRVSSVPMYPLHLSRLEMRA